MKKWLKSSLCVAGFAGCMSLCLAGCGVQTDIVNSSSDIIYNGSVVSVVGDDIIFSNGYSSSEISTMDDYNTYANTSYLATVNSNDLTGDMYLSPESTKLKGEVTGFSNMYSFVYGDSIYYAAPNKHRTSSNQYVFTYVSFFKCAFDGSGETELLTTSSYDSATAQIRALKYGDNAYLFVYDGTQLNCINLSNDDVTTISSAATSVALPSEGEQWNGTVYYSEDKENSYGQAGNAAFKFSVADGQSVSLSVPLNYSVSFTGRSQDNVFYTLTYAPTSVSHTRLATAAQIESTTLNTAGRVFYSSAISNIKAAGGQNMQQGYVFTSSLSGNSQILFMPSNSTAPTVLLSNSDYTDLLLVYGDYVYYANDAGISYKTISTSDVVSVVSDMTIESSKIGYDFYDSGNLKTIYFYAEREYAEDDETEEDERDTNYYLYATNADGSGEVSLIGQTDNPVEDGPNVALIASLSVVGGVLVIGGIVATVIIVRKKRGY